MGIILVNNEQAKRMAKIAMLAKICFAVWGKTGDGKTTLCREVAYEMNSRYVEFLLTVVEAADIGGFPDSSGPRVVYKPLDILPYDSDENVLVVADEVDRAEQDRIAAWMKVMLMDPILGHTFSPNMRTGMTGNGATSLGTNVLPDAAQTRAVHIYLGNAEGGLQSYLDWAPNNGVSGLMQGFAKSNEAVWNGEEFIKEDERKDKQLIELGLPSRRGFDMADKIITVANMLEAEGVMNTKDIMIPLLTGVVGELSGKRLHAWMKDYGLMPSVEEVLNDPMGAPLPDPKRPDIRWSFSVTLADVAAKEYNAETGEGSVMEARRVAEKIVQYASRFPEEPGQFLMKKLMERQAEVIQTPAWEEWNRNQIKSGKTPVVPTPTVVKVPPINVPVPAPVAAPVAVPAPSSGPSLLDQLQDSLNQRPAPVIPTAKLPDGTLRAVAPPVAPPPTPSVDRSLAIEIAKILNGTVEPDNQQWINRVHFRSPNPPHRRYLFAQNRREKFLSCDCKGWINSGAKHTCSHTRFVKEELGKLGISI